MSRPIQELSTAELLELQKALTAELRQRTDNQLAEEERGRGDVLQFRLQECREQLAAIDEALKSMSNT